MAVAPNWKTLFEAVERNDQAAVKRFVDDGQPISTANPKGDTAAHVAAKKRNFEMVKYFGSKEPSLLRTKNSANQNVLHLAVAGGSLDIVKYLVDDMHFDILHPDNVRLGNNAVHMAARDGHAEILKYFIEEKHVDVNVLNEEGEPPVFLAASNKKLPVIKLLHEQYNASVEILNHKNQNILFPAALVGDVTVPEYILDQRKVELHIDWKDNVGRTILHWSSLRNYLKISQYFVDIKKADVNMYDQMKQTPLHLAAQAGHIKLVEFLYEAGADPELEDAEGKKPADLTKNKKVVQFLADHPKIRERRSVPNWITSRDRFSVQQPVPYGWAHRIASSVLSSPACLSNGRTIRQQVASVNGPEGFLALANVFIGYNERARNQTLLSPTESIRNRMDPVAADVIENLN